MLALEVLKNSFKEYGMRFILLAVVFVLSFPVLASDQIHSTAICRPTQTHGFVCAKSSEDCQLSCEKVGYCLSVQSFFSDCAEKELVSCLCWGKFDSDTQ
jgi:hypothetical protein